ncbi:dihydrolipoamide acetyltransferase family protein [Saxibacter everestensis]|uniref:Dihydrolipoamide acetyltransferase component of pyruvate dehydrogenase complex n=1 Tax=Saxibacter everestensis TaxID=2909229 RepID=A0ABY8QQ89_9MICO|nr:dihydrolipoamide acetyltransferase family protein [Brevibacteriaceae bacterium ZFBP1038]
MSKQFLLPDLGEGLTEAEIISWLVKPGDSVSIDQLIVEVESAKSVVELPCPFAGIIEAVHVQAGEMAEAGQPLVTVGDGTGERSDNDGGIDAGAEAPEVLTGDAPATATADADGGVDAGVDAAELVPGTAIRDTETEEASGAVLIGYGTTTSTRTIKRPAGARFGARGRRSAESSGAAPGTAGAASTAPVTAPSSDRDSRLDVDRSSPVISPIVRKLAHSHGFEARHLKGSGPGDLVTRADVESYIAEQKTAGPAPAGAGSTESAPVSSAPAADAPAADASAVDASGDVRTKISGLRKVVSDRLSLSRREIPEATIWLDVDATELLRAKDQLQQATGERFSVMALIARFVVAGLRRHPILNSSIDTVTNEIVQHGRINLGLAAQTPRGLMVPVVRDAGPLTTRQLRDRIGELVSASASGHFAPAQLSGGTFTLNNYGVFGVDGSAAIINHPEAAILGIGRIMDRPWVVDGELAVRKVVVLSLAFDHRVCDGEEPSKFIKYVAGCIENPMAFLADS